MSQFRIKKIDQGLIDEWVPRLNDDGIQLGDDIDARDPNELSEAMIDTQEVILKTSVLAANQILNPSSGIAERLTLLEATAGQATLQDVYENGSAISVQSGRPLVFGSGEAIKLDDAGNLTFRPTTMRVRGAGASFVEISNSSIASTLGDMFFGSVSPGYDLTVRSVGEFYLQDVYLNNPITLSEASNSSLDTTSQSIVGAINELKSSAFTVSLQSVYSQSSPPRIQTNLTSGPVHIEDPNTASVADAFRVTGNARITKKLVAGSAELGTTLTYSDTNGLATTRRISSTVEVRTPLIDATINDLTLKDKRLTVALTDNAVSSLETNSGSIIGALNELKANIDSVGGALTVFDQQHNPANGEHTFITTQAGIGENTLKRIIVRNQSGSDTFSVTGEGNMEAEELTLQGLDVVDLLNQLNNHLSNDGTAHSAVAAHLSASNPHNTVKSLNGLSDVISLQSSDGSISVLNTGNIINITANDISTLQSVYDNAADKKFDMDSTGFRFVDDLSGQMLVHIRDLDFLLNRNLYFGHASAEITSIAALEVRAQDNLVLSSQVGDVEIATADNTRQVFIQDVAFDDTVHKELPVLGATSVLQNFQQLEDDKTILIPNTGGLLYNPGNIITLDQDQNFWLPVPNMHDANEYVSSIDFFRTNLSNLLVYAETLTGGNTEKFFKRGMLTVDVGPGPDTWYPHSDIYLGARGYSEWNIIDVTQFSDGDTVTILPGDLNKVIQATTGVPNALAGIFKIEDTGNPNLDTDKTRENLINTLNNRTWQELNGDILYLRAGIHGEYARGSFKVDGTITPGQVLQINPHVDMDGASVTFTAVADNADPGYLEFRVGQDVEEAASNIAELINKTTFYQDASQSTEGHLCFAEASGAKVKLKWWKPGISPREITLVTGSPNVTANQFIGGKSKLRIYKQEPDITSLQVTSSNTSAITATDISPDESACQLITEERALSSKRPDKDDFTPVKIGTIEEVSGTTLRIRVGN